MGGTSSSSLNGTSFLLGVAAALAVFFVREALLCANKPDSGRRSTEGPKPKDGGGSATHPPDKRNEDAPAPGDGEATGHDKAGDGNADHEREGKCYSGSDRHHMLSHFNEEAHKDEWEAPKELPKSVQEEEDLAIETLLRRNDPREENIRPLDRKVTKSFKPPSMDEMKRVMQREEYLRPSINSPRAFRDPNSSLFAGREHMSNMDDRAPDDKNLWGVTDAWMHSKQEHLQRVAS